ncbi:FumA C-terminus/TtdB family hydratase beta subunit, partial [Lentzea sp.]|uniref:FumA C-terminus/TtdB family hydratase beta subunit n=1 Tax=Lentzea sp. TaxID=56099 RepID=UPI002C3BCE02
VAIDLRQPMASILETLSKLPVKTRLSLSGPLVVARDIAHAKIKERLDAGEPMPAYLRDHAVYYAGPAKTPAGYASGSFGPTTAGRMDAYVDALMEAGEPMPQYMKDHPVYYAGPAKTPEGYASGSFGPTTAGRMDSYVEQFQAAGGSLVMLAKGNRSKQVTNACSTHGGFYLGSIGGPAARLAQDCIRKVEVLEYPELGMEAVWKIEVEDFPAFVVVDDKGNDFFAETSTPTLQISFRR